MSWSLRKGLSTIRASLSSVAALLKVWEKLNNCYPRSRDDDVKNTFHLFTEFMETTQSDGLSTMKRCDSLFARSSFKPFFSTFRVFVAERFLISVRAKLLSWACTFRGCDLKIKR